MDQFHEWLNVKLSRRSADIREARIVSHEWERLTGGRIHYAGLTMSVEPAKEFALTVKAENVPEELVCAAKDGLFTELLARWQPVLALKIELRDFIVREPDASQGAFYVVTIEALRKCLGPVEGDWWPNLIG